MNCTAYRTCRPVFIRCGMHEILAYVYDVRDTPVDDSPGLLPSGNRSGPPRGSERIELPFRVDGYSAIPTDIPGRKPIATHLGRMRLVAILTPVGQADGRLYVQWQCECGGRGVMAARLWAQRRNDPNRRSAYCEFCVGAAEAKREPAEVQHV